MHGREGVRVFFCGVELDDDVTIESLDGRTLTHTTRPAVACVPVRIAGITVSAGHETGLTVHLNSARIELDDAMAGRRGPRLRYTCQRKSGTSTRS